MKNCQVIFEKSIFAKLKNLLNQKDLFLRNSCPPSMLKAHTFDSLKQVLDCNRDREYFSKVKRGKTLIKTLLSSSMFLHELLSLISREKRGRKSREKEVRQKNLILDTSWGKKNPAQKSSSSYFLVQ